MTWKRISDINVVCKRCNLGMVFESSLNDTNIILVCSKCNDHVNLELKGDGTHRGVGMPPPKQQYKNKFCTLGGIVRNGMSKTFVFKLGFHTQDEAQHYKEMLGFILGSNLYSIDCSRGYYDKKKDDK